MHKVPDNIDLLLPYGESLRAFVEQRFILPGDLRRTLRRRGIFQTRSEKNDTIPLLVCGLLSPEEFDLLRECQATAEDNPKTSTQTIAWSSNRSILDAIPNGFSVADLIAGEITNYKVIGSPTFVPVGSDPERVSFEYEIEREDYTKSWAATKNLFRGKLLVEKHSSGTSLKFTLTHTADETKDLNRQIVRRLNQNFKASGDIKQEAEAETILFSSFDNISRVAFFASLSSRLQSQTFEFCDTTDFGACPDDRIDLPPSIKWMEEKVSALKIKGTALEETFFIKEPKYHKFLLLYSIEAKLNFRCAQAKGQCSVVFEFHDFATKKNPNAELEINISSVVIDSASMDRNKTAVKELLLREINDYKLLQFERYKIAALAPIAPPRCEVTSMAPELQGAFSWDTNQPERPTS